MPGLHALNQTRCGAKWLRGVHCQPITPKSCALAVQEGRGQTLFLLLLGKGRASHRHRFSRRPPHFPSQEW